MNLFKREYLRGIIDGQTAWMTNRLSEKYTLAELNEIYEIYLNNNQEVEKELNTIINNGSSN